MTKARIRSMRELQGLLALNIRVFYMDANTEIWYRVLSMQPNGKSRLLVLTPCDEFYTKRRSLSWMLSWDEIHKQGRIRESFVVMFNRRDRLVTYLPQKIVSFLEANDCLRLMDPSLFS